MSVADRAGMGPKREEKQVEGGWEVYVTPHPMFWGGKKEPPKHCVKLTDEQFLKYKMWLGGDILIQNALPDLTASQREVLMSGLGDEEFNELAMEDEEDEDGDGEFDD